jgi:hypothetical protein
MRPSAIENHVRLAPHWLCVGVWHRRQLASQFGVPAQIGVPLSLGMVLYSDADLVIA